MAEKRNYCKSGSGKEECGGCKSKAELLMQMYKNRDVPTDVRDPGTRTAELYPLKQRAP